jgi:ABC-2 type transport system ATP-binding protein
VSEDIRLVEAKRLSFQPRRGQGLTVAEATFTLKSGFTALIGPNGAGKTTLMRLMAGLYAPSHGQLTIHPTAIRALAYVPQFPGAYRRLSARQFLMRMGAWEGYSSETLASRVEQALVQMRLQLVADVRGRHLDHSQRQRLALASVFVQNSRVVLLDEPTADLDPRQRLQFWQDLYRWSEHPKSPQGYLITTHHLSEVEHYCQHVLVLDRGRVRFDGTALELLAQAQGHTFWSESPIASSNDAPIFEVSWQLGRRHAILSERSSPEVGWVVRPPTLSDGYLMTLRGRVS